MLYLNVLKCEQDVWTRCSKLGFHVLCWINPDCRRQPGSGPKCDAISLIFVWSIVSCSWFISTQLFKIRDVFKIWFAVFCLIMGASSTHRLNMTLTNSFVGWWKHLSYGPQLSHSLKPPSALALLRIRQSSRRRCAFEYMNSPRVNKKDLSLNIYLNPLLILIRSSPNANIVAAERTSSKPFHQLNFHIKYADKSQRFRVFPFLMNCTSSCLVSVQIKEKMTRCLTFSNQSNLTFFAGCRSSWRNRYSWRCV